MTTAGTLDAQVSPIVVLACHETPSSSHDGTLLQYHCKEGLQWSSDAAAAQHDMTSAMNFFNCTALPAKVVQKSGCPGHTLHFMQIISMTALQQAGAVSCKDLTAQQPRSTGLRLASAELSGMMAKSFCRYTHTHLQWAYLAGQMASAATVQTDEGICGCTGHASGMDSEVTACPEGTDLSGIM